MKLTVFNGSPRGKDSNTGILLEQFTNGFMTTDGNSYELAYLVQTKKQDEFVRLFSEADLVLLAFPLYTDAMPGIVKTFIESLEPFCDKKGNPDIGFIMQSGFPESAHSRYVARYLEKLAERLGCVCKGTVIRGGVEGIQGQPAPMTRKLFKSFYQLGKFFGHTGKFDDDIVRRLSKPEKVNKLYSLMVKYIGTNLYWNPLLKKNNTYSKRFARPDL